MKVFNLFSRDQKKENGEKPDTYNYDIIPNNLRVQIVHILEDGFGTEEDFHNSYSYGDTRGAYEAVVSILRREYGVFHLTGEKYRDDNSRLELINYFLSEQKTPKVLDVVQLVLNVIENQTNTWPGKFSGQAPSLISELNYRFREAAVGYQYTSGKIIRVDSEFTHSEVIKPALKLLRDKRLQTVEKEFLAAHEHFRAGEYQDCLTDCGCALESMMKIMLSESGESGFERKTANSLAQTLFDKAILPKQLQAQFTSLQALITSGTPSLRNNMGAHGHGVSPISVPENIASYSLNLTASNILLLQSLR